MAVVIETGSVAPMASKAVLRGWQQAAVASSPLPPRERCDDDPRITPDVVPPFRRAIAGAQIKDLSKIFQELNHLLAGPELDENGDRLRPTRYAYDLCCDLLVSAAIDDVRTRSQSSDKGTPRVAIPMGMVSTDDSGGLRIEWVRDNASVHLAIPSNDKSAAYIYTEIGDVYGTADATAELLAQSLRNID